LLAGARTVVRAPVFAWLYRLHNFERESLCKMTKKKILKRLDKWGKK
jgi:hypothetical protein